jgi:DNA-binding MarR family transcriptional regulator
MKSAAIEGLKSAVRHARGVRRAGRSYKAMVKELKRPDPIAPSTIYLLYRAHQLAEAVWAGALGDKLTPRQFHLMMAIKELGPKSQCDLVDHTGIDRSTLSDMVRRMRGKGLIAPIGSSDADARLRIVDLSAKGRRLLTEVASVALKVDAFIEQQLDRAELREAHRMLSRIIELPMQPDRG